MAAVVQPILGYFGLQNLCIDPTVDPTAPAEPVSNNFCPFFLDLVSCYQSVRGIFSLICVAEYGIHLENVTSSMLQTCLDVLILTYYQQPVTTIQNKKQEAPGKQGDSISDDEFPILASDASVLQEVDATEKNSENKQ